MICDLILEIEIYWIYISEKEVLARYGRMGFHIHVALNMFTFSLCIFLCFEWLFMRICYLDIETGLFLNRMCCLKCVKIILRRSHISSYHYRVYLLCVSKMFMQSLFKKEKQGKNLWILKNKILKWNICELHVLSHLCMF